MENTGLLKAGPGPVEFEAEEGKVVRFSDVHGCEEAKAVSSDFWSDSSVLMPSLKVVGPECRDLYKEQQGTSARLGSSGRTTCTPTSPRVAWGIGEALFKPVI